MDPVTIPPAVTSDEHGPGIDSLDELAVVALADAIRSELRQLATVRPVTADVVSRMRELRAGLDLANTRAAALADETAALEAAAAELTADLDDELTAAAETADGGSEMTDPAPAVEELTSEPDPIVVPDPAPIVPFTGRDAVAELRRRQNPAAPAPVPAAPRSQFGLVAAQPIHVPGPNGRHLDTNQAFTDADDFAKVVTDLRHRMGLMTLSGRSFEYIGHADMFADQSGQFADRLAANDPVLNFGLLGRATDPALVASGALCAPDNPIYDFFRVAVPQAPVEAALPVVPAPRGGIRYIQTPDFRSARAAIGTRTKAQNLDPETADKPCSRAVCPNIAEAYVTAVSECVRWDNLQYRAFPELVGNYMSDVAVNFASVKECLYLTAIDAASTAVTAAVPVYGALRALAFQLRNAAAGYRKRQNMLRTAILDWYAPNWVTDLLMADAMNDNANGLNLNGLIIQAEAVLNQIFANLNIRPIWFNDQANCVGNWTGDTQAWRQAQSAGALNLFPNTMISYLHAPGTFVRLDSGTLDVGLVRDSALNGTNDLELFMEQWVGVVNLGVEAIKITHTLCPNGSAPDAVTAMSCA